MQAASPAWQSWVPFSMSSLAILFTLRLGAFYTGAGVVDEARPERLNWFRPRDPGIMAIAARIGPWPCTARAWAMSSWSSSPSGLMTSLCALALGEPYALQLASFAAILIASPSSPTARAHPAD